MKTILAYLQIWRLKLNYSKTVTTAFYLDSQEAKRELLFLRVTLLRQFVRSGVSAGAKTLRAAVLSLVYSTAEYYGSGSQRTHSSCRQCLNDALCTVTGCLRSTPTDRLPILSGIQPAELCRLGPILSLINRGTLDLYHMLHGLLNGYLDAGQVRLRLDARLYQLRGNY